MALPAGITTFTLSFGPYTDAQGVVTVEAPATARLFPVDPATGARIKLTHLASGQVIVPSNVRVHVNGETGVATVGPLPHTDQAGLSMVGFAYRVEWDIASSKPSPGDKTFAVPVAKGATADFDLLEVSDTPGILVPVVTGATGPAGVVDDASMAAIAADPESAFAAAQKATFAPGAVPSHLTTTHTGGYDRRLSVYGLKPKHLRRIRAALAAVRTGTGNALIAVAGDSTTYGANATPGTSDYPTLIRKMLDGAGYPSKGEMCIGYNATITSGTVDPRLALTGSWGALSGLFAYAGAAASLTFTSTVAGTAVRIYTYDATPVSVSIDGGAAVQRTPTGTGPLMSVEITGLADTTHTVQVAWVSGVLVLHAIEVYRAASGVRMLNAGCSGQSSEWFANNGDTTWGAIPVINALAPQLVVINLGINDIASPFTVGQVSPFSANIQKIITAVKPTADVALVAHSNCDGRDYSAQFDALYTLADTNDVPLVDVGDAMGSYTEAASLGLMSGDPLHPLPAGYGVIGRVLYNALAL